MQSLDAAKTKTHLLTKDTCHAWPCDLQIIIAHSQALIGRQCQPNSQFLSHSYHNCARHVLLRPAGDHWAQPRLSGAQALPILFPIPVSHLYQLRTPCPHGSQVIIGQSQGSQGEKPSQGTPQDTQLERDQGRAAAQPRSKVWQALAAMRCKNFGACGTGRPCSNPEPSKRPKVRQALAANRCKVR